MGQANEDILPFPFKVLTRDFVGKGRVRTDFAGDLAGVGTGIFLSFTQLKDLSFLVKPRFVVN